ncbi:MAG: class I SAM-dependent methyltransferase [Methanomassiliicoccales archaeon]|nr:class I SAM-dependent methyltransferase [Methanomassiliicoccales archaeon]
MPYDRDQYRVDQTSDFISIFYPELKKDIEECSVLDVGSGLGTVSLSLARRAKSIVGIEPVERLMRKASEEALRKGITNVRFENLSAYDLKPTHAFDVVILSDVLEHVPDQRMLLERCLDSLAPGGVLYLNTPNKWFPMEPHMRMLFLSYLPTELANHYARAFGHSGYEGYHLLGYRRLLDLLDSLPVVYKFKTQPNPRRPMYRIGNRLVTNAPFMWRFANAFQLIVQQE